MSSSSTSDIRLDILFKKAVGLADAFPNQSASLENVVNRPAVYPGLQIYQQSIPQTAPGDITTQSFTPANGSVTINGSSTSRYISTSYPYIAKYNYLKLKDATGSSNKQVSYYYSSANNLLQYSIPNGYDSVTNTYNITVYDKNGVVIPSNDTVNPWVLDNDSGIITFTSTAANYTFTTGPPSVTFWRYEGIFGFPSTFSVDLSTNSRLFVTSDVSMGARLFVLNDVSFGRNMYTNGRAIFQGDVSMNNR